jgi:HAE1 family hydrophobic/amphiphilic exporter-1
VTEIAKKQIKEDLDAVTGVGAVVLVGGEARAVNVTVRPRDLQARRLSAEDVRRALVAQNLELPGGKIDTGATEFGLRTLGRIQTPKDFEEIIVATQTSGNGSKHAVRLKEVATVVDSVEEPRGKSRLDGNVAVSLVVQKQSGGNTVAVADAVKARLAKVQSTLPADIQLEVIRDQSKFIKGSIEEVKFHLVLAALLVSGVIFLFIRDWRTTLIAATAVPTSIIGTFAFMDVMGFSLNNMTLLGLILAVGIVIDDAVVVLENVFRHMEQYGQSGREAASSATKEIALAVLATTLSLAVIFAPIAFMSGQVGRFFNSFGFVVGFAILLSMSVSFTLTPMLCARFLKPVRANPDPEGGGGRHPVAHAPGSPGHRTSLLTRNYLRILGWSLRHRWVVVLATVLTFLSTPVLFMLVGSDFVPKDDAYEIYTSPASFSGVREALEAEGYTFISAEVQMIPQNMSDIASDAEIVEKLERMFERFDDNDDVNEVFHNAILPEEEEED